MKRYKVRKRRGGMRGGVKTGRVEMERKRQRERERERERAKTTTTERVRFVKR